MLDPFPKLGHKTSTANFFMQHAVSDKGKKIEKINMRQKFIFWLGAINY